MRFIYSIACLFALALPLRAQDIFLKTQGQSATVCGSNITFTIEVRNLSSQSLTNVVVNSSMPAGVTFVQETSTPSSYQFGSPAGNPSFSLGTMAPAAVRTITYTAKVDCGLVTYLNDNNIVNGLVNNQTRAVYNLNGVPNTFSEPHGSESYNVFYPVLTLVVNPTDKDKAASRLEDVTRSITITNTGNGVLTANNAFMEITREYGLSFLSLTGANVTLDQSVTNKTTVRFNDFGNGDATLDPGQSVTLVEKVKVNSCDDLNLTSNYFVKWGCNSGVCNAASNNSQDGSLIRIFSGSAALVTTSDETLTFCQDPPATVIFTITNSKPLVDPAQDRANRAAGVGFSLAVASFVTPSDFKVQTTTGDWISITPASSGVNNYSFESALLAKGSLIGFSDIDGDGVYSDLMPQKSIKVSVRMMTSCIPELSNPKGSVNTQFFSSLSYSYNACGAYSNGTFHNSFPIISSNGPSKLTGPIDLLPNQTGTYTFNISRSMIMRCSSAAFSSDVTFPSRAYKVTEVKWIPSSGSATLLSFTQDANGTLHVTGGGNFGRYEVKVTLDCSLGTTNTPSSLLEWKSYLDCSGTCCRQFLGYETLEVFNHCIQAGNGVCFKTESFNVERTTFGYAEPSSGFYTQLPATRLNRNSPGIRLNAAMETDGIEAVAKGSVAFGSFDNAHVEVQYISPVPENILEFVNGYFLVNSGSGNQTFPIVTAPTVSSTDQNYFFDFKVDGVSTFAQGTTVELHANFKIKRSSSLAPGEFPIQRFRAFHYGLSGGTKFGCETFGSLFTLVKYSIQSTTNFFSTSYGCPTPLTPRLRFAVVGLLGGSADPFPGEFRPNTRIRDIRMKTPVGTAYTLGTFAVNSSPINLSAPQITPRADGDELLWSGTQLPICDYIAPQFNFDFTPQCFTQIPSPASLPVTTNYSNYEFDEGNAQVIPFTQPHNFTKVITGLQIQANITQDAFAQTVSWPVTLCENSLAESQNYTWLTFVPPANVNLVSAKVNGVDLPITQFDPSAPYKRMIKVGKLNNTCVTIILTATYTNCRENVTDNIELKAGRSCGDYPSNPEIMSCASLDTPVSGVISIRYKNADLSQTVTKINPKSNLCESIPFEVELLSSGIGNMQEVFSLLDLPTGIIFKPGTGQYRLSASSAWTPFATNPTNITVNGISGLGWNLSASVLGGGEFINQTKIFLKFELEATCSGTFIDNYDPGVPVIITTTGKTNCGDIRTRSFQSKIEINGFDISGNNLIPIVAVDEVCLNGFVPKARITVTNPGVTPSKPQDLVVVLPPGVKYQGVIEGAAVPSSVVKLGGITTITWKLNNSIAPAQTIGGFNFAFSVSDLNLSSILVETRTFIFGSGTCTASGTICSLRATTGLSLVTANIKKDNCFNCQTPVPVAEPICAQQEATFSAWNGANVTVTCSGEDIIIANNGNGNIMSDLTYTVYYSDAGQVVQNIVQNTFKLNVGESLPIKQTSGNLTVSRLEVEQAPFNIHNSGIVFDVNQAISGTYCSKVTVSYLSAAPLSWDFGDGETATGSIVNHVYSYSGDYDVTLTYCNGQQLVMQYTSLDCRIIDPDVYYNCSNDPQVNRWIVYNANSLDLKIDYEIVNSPFHGSFTVPAERDTTFFTPVIAGNRYIKVKWLNERQELRERTYANYGGICPVEECDNCYSSFTLLEGKEYVLSAWVKEESPTTMLTYENAAIALDFSSNVDTTTMAFNASGVIVDGWQRIWSKFIVPADVNYMTVKLLNQGGNEIYFDDVRIHPFNANMKSFVYDPASQRLMAELDENNYATFYEYDEEGALIRVKKETERGVKTVQESRNNTVKRSHE